MTCYSLGWCKAKREQDGEVILRSSLSNLTERRLPQCQGNESLTFCLRKQQIIVHLLLIEGM